MKTICTLDGRIIMTQEGEALEAMRKNAAQYPGAEASVVEDVEFRALVATQLKTAGELAAEAECQATAQAKTDAKAAMVVQYLRDHTPAECAQYVQANVTDLASAKAFLKKVAIVLCALSKESLR